MRFTNAQTRITTILLLHICSISTQTFSVTDIRNAPADSDQYIKANNDEISQIIDCLVEISSTVSRKLYRLSQNDMHSRLHTWNLSFEQYLRSYVFTENKVLKSIAEKIGWAVQDTEYKSCKLLPNKLKLEPSNFKKVHPLTRAGSLWSMVFSLHPISGYACWCHFGKKAGQGAGLPQNMVDEICMDLQLCYRCIKHDDPTCEPWETDYLVQMTHTGITDTTYEAIVSMCDINGHGSCPYNICACEMKMLTEFWNKITLTSYLVDYSYKHSNGFDYAGICKTEGYFYGEKKCCGNFPDRKPYGLHQDKKCCHNLTIYHPNNKICCPDGSTTDIGSMCAV